MMFGIFGYSAGLARLLANLHINYETVPPYEGVKVTGDESDFYTVEKMRFPSKGQKDTILYNSKILRLKHPRQRNFTNT